MGKYGREYAGPARERERLRTRPSRLRKTQLLARATAQPPGRLRCNFETFAAIAVNQDTQLEGGACHGYAHDVKTWWKARQRRCKRLYTKYTHIGQEPRLKRLAVGASRSKQKSSPSRAQARHAAPLRLTPAPLAARAASSRAAATLAGLMGSDLRTDWIT